MPLVATIGLTIIVTLVVFTVARNLVPRGTTHAHPLQHRYGVADPQFARDMGQLLGPPLVDGNRITTLVNGDAIFPAILEAIRGAQHSVTFETYIYWSGSIGAIVADALAERARAGVRVHVLLDWLGSSRIDHAVLSRLAAAGADVVRYHPLRWYTADRLNNRTHRKLLVVDGRIGFTGGAGIADQWLGDAQDAEHWRDTHYRVEGPVTAQLQAAFMDNWLRTRGEVLLGEGYFPALGRVGDSRAQLFKSSSREGSESIRLMYLMTFAAARESIRLAHSYFVPDHLTCEALMRARQRGVTVDIIVPGPVTDTRFVRAASRSRWQPLLHAGVRIWEYQPTMYHCKIMVVDGCWTSVGSTNLDNRSFSLNDEANLNVLDPDFAAEQVRQFEADRARSREVTLRDWRRASWPRRTVEWLAGLTRSQL